MGEQAPQKSYKAGLLVILLLASIFFVLLIALVFSGDKQPVRQSTGPEKLFVIAPRARVRNQPRAGAPVVATAVKDDSVMVVEDAGVWVRVRTADGVVGWAERSLLAGEQERQRRVDRAKAITKLPALDAVVRKRTTLYAGPGLFYPIVGELAPDVPVKVYTRDHDFYALAYSGDIAYATIDDIDLSAEGAQFEVAAEQSVQPAVPIATETTTTTVAELPSESDIPQGGEPPSLQPDRIGVYPAVPSGGTQPQIARRTQPRYPRAARAANIQGTVIIRAVVRKDGSPDQVEILRDVGGGLGEAAREAVEQWQFIPATYRGDPIDVYYTVTVNFRLR